MKKSRSEQIVNHLILFVFLTASITESRNMKFIGSPQLGILPKDAERVCEKNGAKLASITPENLLFFEEQLFANCDPKSDFCPKMCVWETNESAANRSADRRWKENKVIMTQPIKEGDTLHLKIRMENGSLEVYELSDLIMNDFISNTAPKQHVSMRLSIFNNHRYIYDGVVHSKISIAFGTVEKSSHEWTLSDSFLTPEEIPLQKTIETVALTLKFTKNKLTVTAPSLFNGSHTVSIGAIKGRMYLTKHYESELLNAYFTRGNCPIADFHYKSPNKTDGFVNCHWTRGTHSVPLFSCRMASFVACKVTGDAIVDTTDATDTDDSQSELDRELAIAELRFYAEFIDHHKILMAITSLLSIAMVVSAIALQLTKMKM